MTISTELTKITYPANGSTTVWSFSFPAGPNPDIRVFVKDALGVETEIHTNFQVNTNAAIAPNPTSVGGNVVYPVSGAPLALGNSIILARDVPLIQPTSLANQAILYQEVIEAALDYIVMEVQQLQQQIDENLIFNIPPCPERANKFLAFDADCNPVAVGNSNPITSTNGIRVPNTEVIPPLPGAALRPGQFISFAPNGDPILVSSLPPNIPPFFGAMVTLTAVHTVANSEKGFLFVLNGNVMFDLILGNPTTYDTNFSCAVFNADIYTGPGSGRGKRVLLNGTIMPGGLLWPGQWVYIFRIGSTWVTNPRDQRWKVGVNPTFFVDQVNGFNDGTSDGLATGTGAIKNVNVAVGVALARVDYGAIGGAITGATVQLAVGTYTENIVVNSPTVGGVPITIKGADDFGDPTPWIVLVPPNSVGILVDFSANVVVKGLNIGTTGANAIGVKANRGSTAVITTCKFEDFPGQGFHMFGLNSSTLDISNVIIASGAAVCFAVLRSSTAKLSGQMTVNPALTFQIFAVAQYNSQIVGGTALFGDPTNFTLVGGAGCIGNKYFVQFNSIGNLGAGVMDALPGSAGGLTGGTSPLHGTDSSAVY